MIKKKLVAIIPARGGSKRIPRKNIILFCGKPMIAWTIEAAQKSKLFDEIVVSTDDPEIAKISEEYGAVVPFLRKNKADDFSPVSEATIHTLKQLEDEGMFFDEVVQLFAVCPLRTEKDIKKAYKYYVERNRPFLISCFKYSAMNPWWAVTLNSEKEASWIFDDSKKRSQDLPDLFCPTGAVWIGNVKELYKENSFYGKGHIFWDMNWKNAIDIDTYDDLEFATILKRKND